MKYRPGQETCPLPYSPFKSSTIPRPIGWLSSVSTAGVDNIAPYSQWQNINFDPPMVMFAASLYPDGRRKDTVINAESTGWFVWNMATFALREQVNMSAMALPPGESEFARLAVTRERAALSPAQMVKESPVKFECRYLITHRLPGRSPLSMVDIVYATVEMIHIDDKVIMDNGKLDIASIRPIARLGYSDYTVVDTIFEMRVPESTEVARHGLEGRAPAEK